jgi:hypothetical protein
VESPPAEPPSQSDPDEGFPPPPAAAGEAEEQPADAAKLHPDDQESGPSPKNAQRGDETEAKADAVDEGEVAGRVATEKAAADRAAANSTLSDGAGVKEEDIERGKESGDAAAGLSTKTRSDPGPRATLDQHAHADRVILFPTAYTHPEGTVVLTTIDIVFLQLGFGLTDRTQLTFTATPPLGEDRVVPLDATLKSVLYRGERVRVAALGSISGITGVDDLSGFIGRTGAVVQLCTTETCTSSFNTSAHLALLGPATLLATSHGLAWHIGEWFEVLGEVTFLMPFSERFGEAHGAALGLGFRLPRPRWSLDLALEAPLHVKGNALPVLAFSWRFGP